MKIGENISLKKYNSFGIDVKARYFIELTSNNDIFTFLKSHFLDDKQFLILNGGSNILFTKDFNGVVIKISTQGITIIEENDNWALVKANAGENWNNFVLWCLDRGLGGLENLSLIPGNVGAAPVQNIGAYGVEQKELFQSLEAVEIKSERIVNFSNEECRFGYRDSIFKHDTKNQYIILSVNYKLSKKPALNTSYGDIQKKLSSIPLADQTIKHVSDAVCEIRNSKLPDPAKIGNAGSFFKNPIVNLEQLMLIKSKYPDIPVYPADNDTFKLAAGWMIDKLKCKGFRYGDAGVYHSQALVLVNHGQASGSDILKLAKMIMKSVKENFGVDLEPEVNIH
jgi:UDP-N-acetylmuramate dehydrogenase